MSNNETLMLISIGIVLIFFTILSALKKRKKSAKSIYKLIDALERRKVYAVGLDVYKGEPNLNPGYLKHKSAFILPHLGSATKETRTAMANLAIDNLEEFFKTGNCKNKVN